MSSVTLFRYGFKPGELGVGRTARSSRTRGFWIFRAACFQQRTTLLCQEIDVEAVFQEIHTDDVSKDRCQR